MFKVGDKVRCIKQDPRGWDLDLNKIYTVCVVYPEAIVGTYIYLDNNFNYTYNYTRFVLSYIQDFQDKLENLIDE